MTYKISIRSVAIASRAAKTRAYTVSRVLAFPLSRALRANFRPFESPQLAPPPNAQLRLPQSLCVSCAPEPNGVVLGLAFSWEVLTIIFDAELVLNQRTRKVNPARILSFFLRGYIYSKED